MTITRSPDCSVRADIPTSGLSDARRIVGTLREQATLCRELASSPSPSATPSGSASGEAASPSPTATPSPSPSGTGDAGVSAADCGERS